MTTGSLQIANSNKWKKFNNTRNENKKKMLPIYITCAHITSIWDHPCSLGGIYGVTLRCNCMDNWQRFANTAFGCNLFRRWRNENLTLHHNLKTFRGFQQPQCLRQINFTLQYEHVHRGDYFAIIAFCLHSILLTNYARHGRVGAS